MAKKDSGAAGTAEAAFQYLMDGIRSGIWQDGDKLPSEAQLCRELQISRTSVRSALGRLSGLGLVQSIQGKGSFVRMQSPATVPDTSLFQNADRLDVFEFRRIIESESAALAAMRATAADIRALDATITSMSGESNAEEAAAQDMQFHYLIAKASGNELILGVFDMMHDTYRRMFRHNISYTRTVPIVQHRQILLAIQTRDMDGARRAMLEHLEDTMRDVCGEEFAQ